MSGDPCTVSWYGTDLRVECANTDDIYTGAGRIELDDNGLTGSLPTEIGFLDSFEQVSLGDGNQLTGSLPTEVCPPLPSSPPYAAPSLRPRSCRCRHNGPCLGAQARWLLAHVALSTLARVVHPDWNHETPLEP